jgi:glycosyltransferase involved in cell wall biosynthesis
MWFDRDVEWYADWSRVRLAQRRVFEKISRQCDLVLCVSEYLKNRFVELFPSAEGRVAVVYNGVEDVYFNTGSARQPIGVQPVVIVVGALVPRKGSEMFFALADKMKSMEPNLSFVVVSGKDSPDALRREAERRPNIELLGYCDAPRVAELMSKASVLLQASPTETFGMSIVEAMACGLPVVAVDAMAASEVAGDAAMLVEYGDISSACDAILTLCRDDKVQREFSSKGLARAQKYMWSNCADMLLAALKNKSWGSSEK